MTTRGDSRKLSKSRGGERRRGRKEASASHCGQAGHNPTGDPLRGCGTLLSVVPLRGEEESRVFCRQISPLLGRRLVCVWWGVAVGEG